MVLPPAETYKAVKGVSEIVLRERGSRFIGRAFPVKEESEIQALLARLRKQEWDATHHCSAFRIGVEPSLARADDDGEPSGTAGLPLLRALESAGLTDTFVVATRYYGGTKLGTGGLIRAYGETAKRALEAAGTEVHRIDVQLIIGFAYADTSPAMHLLERYEAKILHSAYDTHTELHISLPASRKETFWETFPDFLSGRGWVKRP